MYTALQHVKDSKYEDYINYAVVVLVCVKTLYDVLR